MVGATDDEHQSKVALLHELPGPLAASATAEELQVAAREDEPDLRALGPRDARCPILV